MKLFAVLVALALVGCADHEPNYLQGVGPLSIDDRIEILRALQVPSEDRTELYAEIARLIARRTP